MAGRAVLVLALSGSPRPLQRPAAFGLRLVNGSSARALATACLAAPTTTCVLALPSRRPVRFAPLAALQLERGLRAADARDPEWSALYLARTPERRVEDALRALGRALAPIFLTNAGRADDALPIVQLNQSRGRHPALVIRPGRAGRAYVASGVVL